MLISSLWSRTRAISKSVCHRRTSTISSNWWECHGPQLCIRVRAKKKKKKTTYVEEGDQLCQSLIARFDPQRIVLGLHQGRDDTLLANLRYGLRSIFKSPGVIINHFGIRT